MTDTSLHRSLPPRLLGFAAALLLIAASAQGDLLTVGSPEISGSTYSFPIFLESDDENVAALNFTFSYDAALFENRGVEAGIQAQLANKLITTNTPQPGSMIVVLVGMNQNTMGSGEIARIQLDQKTPDLAGGAELRLLNESLATAEGLPVPSGSRGHTIPPDGEAPEEDTAPDSPGESPADPENSGGDGPSSPGRTGQNLAAILNDTRETPYPADEASGTAGSQALTAPLQSQSGSDASPDAGETRVAAVIPGGEKEIKGLDKPDPDGVEFNQVGDIGLESERQSGTPKPETAESRDIGRSLSDERGEIGTRGPVGNRWFVHGTLLVIACVSFLVLRKILLG